MFAGARRMADPGQAAAVRPDLPLISRGRVGPVNANLALLTFLSTVTTPPGSPTHVRTYPGAGRDLDQTNCDEVVASIIDWIDQVLSQP